MTPNELKFFIRYLKDEGVYMSYVRDVRTLYSSLCETGIIKNTTKLGDYLLTIPAKEAIMFSLDWSTTELGCNYWNKQYRLFKKYYDENFQKFSNGNPSNPRR